MFYPLPLYIGLRYVVSRSRGFFVSFISWISMAGICLGLTAIITIVSVMNGLEGEMRTRLLSLASQLTVTAEGGIPDWQERARQLRLDEDVVGVAPYVELQGMLGRNQELKPALIRGVDPASEPQVSEISKYMVEGSLADLRPGEQHMVLGSGLAWALDAKLGDEVTVLVPVASEEGEGAIGGIDLRPRIQTFTLSGIFEVNVQEHDSVLALIHLSDAAAIAGTDGAPTGLRVKYNDIMIAPARAQRLTSELDSRFRVSDWSRENASYFRAVGIEKTMMTLILMLVVAIAAFNIVAALVMVVNEKRTDIAILRTYGLTARGIVAVFMAQGIVIGWLGALLGFALGLALAFNVESIAPFLEQYLGIQIFDPTVYYITEVPSEVHWPQVIGVTLTAMILTVLATIYPALRGAQTEPAEALRYE